MSTKYCVVLLYSLSAFAASAQDRSVFRFAEKTDPHAVGLKVIEQYDYSRTYRRRTDEFGKPYQGERARPLQTLVWYPAERTNATPMTVGDYVNLWTTETSFGHPMVSPRVNEWLASMEPTLKMPSWAVRNAKFAAGQFPVVVYTPGASEPSWDNLDLCEYLASHGYVVIAAQDMGATTRDMTIDVAGINSLASDISFLIGFARTLPDTDMSNVAVAGMSWGGIANIFAAARDTRIKALVGLDGSVRYYPALVKKAGDVHPEEMTLPLIYFEQGNFSLEDRDQIPNNGLDGPSVLNAWTHGDLIAIRMLGLAHAELTSAWQRSENYWKDYSWLIPGDYGREDGITGYSWIAQYTLRFLDAYLKNDSAAMAFLKKTPDENGVPRHVLSANYRAGKGSAPSFDGFRAEVGKHGFDHVTQIYADLKSANPEFKLDEGSMTFWAEELITSGHAAEAIELLKLNVQMHLESGAAYSSLGDAYALAGQKQLAIATYRKSLDKDPIKTPAKRKIKKLEETGSK